MHEGIRWKFCSLSLQVFMRSDRMNNNFQFRKEFFTNMTFEFFSFTFFSFWWLLFVKEIQLNATNVKVSTRATYFSIELLLPLMHGNFYLKRKVFLRFSLFYKINFVQKVVCHKIWFKKRWISWKKTFFIKIWAHEINSDSCFIFMWIVCSKYRFAKSRLDPDGEESVAICFIFSFIPFEMCVNDFSLWGAFGNRKSGEKCVKMSVNEK